ncbi:MAG: amidohydrolase family protein [Acidobacteria bacterium]|nr:amidohydrolase family protein [Acidobacteriota bacterium]
MRTRWTFLGFALAVLLAAPRIMSAQTLPPEVAQNGYADMIIVNAKIISVDDAGYNNNPGRIYQAMAVKKDRIMALGDATRIRAMADSRTTVYDMAGMTIIPGIVESHVHIFGDRQVATEMGLKGAAINVSVEAGRDIEATRLKVENAITDSVKKVKPGEWVHVTIRPNEKEKVDASRVFSWVTLGNFEPRERLDRIAPNHPVIVQVASRATINSAAWKTMQNYFPDLDDYYESTLPDVPKSGGKGVIGVEGQVALQWEIWWGSQPISLLADMMRRTMQKAASHGITTFSSRMTHPRLVDTYTLLNRENAAPIRFGLLLEGHRRPRDQKTVRQIYQMTGNLTNLGGDYLWINGVASELWDSSFPQGCLGPDVPAPAEIKAREMCPQPGMLYYDTLKNALGAGWRLAGIHGVASHGVRSFINMVDSVVKEQGLSVEDMRKRRLTVEHAEAMGQQPDIIAGLKKYDIIVSVHPPRLFRTRDYVADYGPKVLPFMQPVKTWLDSGVKVVGQMERYTNVGYVWTILMTRDIGEGMKVNPEEALGREVVLKMWTKWAAEYVMKENDLGSLEVGKMADFVVLDKDYLTVPIAEIPSIKPQMTVVGGKPVFFDAEFAKKFSKDGVGWQFPAGYKPWGEYVPEYGAGDL